MSATTSLLNRAFSADTAVREVERAFLQRCLAGATRGLGAAPVTPGRRARRNPLERAYAQTTKFVHSAQVAELAAELMRQVPADAEFGPFKPE